ncbi:MAG: hypothetical protein F6K48_17280 [Okeania sp. SIO3H1]|nr:hypothetical protein [Okeania sp. SIO3H1]
MRGWGDEEMGGWGDGEMGGWGDGEMGANFNLLGQHSLSWCAFRKRAVVVAGSHPLFPLFSFLNFLT